MATGKAVKLIFNIKRDSDGIPVYFKSDGQRFEQQLTIKFQRDETYRVDVTVRPAVPVEILRLQDENISIEKISKFIDPNALSYSGVWKTAHFPLTEKNKRELIKITVVMKGMPMFSAIIQCKFYENTDTQHARWGDKMTNLEFEGVVTQDGAITVQKQQIIAISEQYGQCTRINMNMFRGRRNKTHKVLVCQEIELPTLPVFLPVRDDGSLAFYRLPGSDPVPNVPVCKDPLPDIRILFTIPHLNYSTILTLPARRTTTPNSLFVTNQPIGTNLGNAYFPVINNANSAGAQNGLNNLNGGLPFLGNLINLGLNSLNESRNAVASVSGNIKVSVVQSSSNHMHADGKLTADVGFNITQNFNIGPRPPLGNANATLSGESTATNVTNWPNQTGHVTTSMPSSINSSSSSLDYYSTTPVENGTSMASSSPVIPVSPDFTSTTASSSTSFSEHLTSVQPVTYDQNTTVSSLWTTSITHTTSLPTSTPIKRCPERTTDLALLRAPMQNGIVCGYFLDLSNRTIKNFCDDISHTWDLFHATVPFMETCCAAWIMILRCDQITTGPSPAYNATTAPFTDFFSWNTNTTSISTTSSSSHESIDLDDWNNALGNVDNLVLIKAPEDDTFVPPVPMKRYYPNPVNVFDSSKDEETDHTYESEFSPDYLGDEVSAHSDYVESDKDFYPPPLRFDSYHDVNDNQQAYGRDYGQDMGSSFKLPGPLLPYPMYPSPSAMSVNPGQMFPPNPVWKPSARYRQ